MNRAPLQTVHELAVAETARRSKLPTVPLSRAEALALLPDTERCEVRRMKGERVERCTVRVSWLVESLPHNATIKLCPGTQGWFIWCQIPERGGVAEIWLTPDACKLRARAIALGIRKEWL